MHTFITIRRRRWKLIVTRLDVRVRVQGRTSSRAWVVDHADRTIRVRRCGRAITTAYMVAKATMEAARVPQQEGVEVLCGEGEGAGGRRGNRF